MLFLEWFKRKVSRSWQSGSPSEEMKDRRWLTYRFTLGPVEEQGSLQVSEKSKGTGGDLAIDPSPGKCAFSTRITYTDNLTPCQPFCSKQEFDLPGPEIYFRLQRDK